MSDSDDLRNRAENLRQAMPGRQSGTPPQENGKRLGTINRSETEQIRINWSEYDGHPFLSIRMWKRYDDGTWWPDKRGIAIRVRELPDLVVAMAEAVDLAQDVADNWSQRRTAPPPPRRPPLPTTANGPQGRPGDQDLPY